MTMPPPPTTLDLQGTLNALAGTSNLGNEAAANVLAGLPIGTLSVLGALNVKAGNGTSPSGWYDMATVCNQLAGTTNLDPLQALQVYLTEGG